VLSQSIASRRIVVVVRSTRKQNSIPSLLVAPQKSVYPRSAMLPTLTNRPPLAAQRLADVPPQRAK